MSWAVGYDECWKRDIGYGVPSWCDHPDCTEKICRGLTYVCGGAPYGGDRGCGLYFCSTHLNLTLMLGPLCERCYPRIKTPFCAKADHPEWVEHKRTDPSWANWREAQLV